MKHIKLPPDSEYLIVGFQGEMSKMSPEQRLAMASLNEQAKKRQAEIENFTKEKEKDMNQSEAPQYFDKDGNPVTPLIPAPSADEAAKTIPGPPEKEFLPDPLEKKNERDPLMENLAEKVAKDHGVLKTNSLRYTQDTLAVEFERIFKEEIMALRNAGQKEYAHDASSPFANFERGAKDMGIDRKQVLWCYAMKHKDGIAAALQGHDSQREDVRGRINDLIVYLLLLRGIFNEEAGNTGNFGLGDLG